MPWTRDQERHQHTVLLDTKPDKMTATVLIFLGIFFSVLAHNKCDKTCVLTYTSSSTTMRYFCVKYMLSDNTGGPYLSNGTLGPFVAPMSAAL